MKAEIFSGWKEIANYLGRGVRTVQRYEREQRLPVHRLAGKSAGSVVATRTELDGWITAGPVRSDSIRKRWPFERTNRIAAEFLQIDSDVALTFSNIALETNDARKKTRTARTARRAYDTIMHLRKGIEMTDAEKDKLDANMRRLKTELHSLGA
jgi:hypothetical protein